MLQAGRGLTQWKYRLYRQLQKQESQAVRLAGLEKAYGEGGSTYSFSDGSKGWIVYDHAGMRLTIREGPQRPELHLSWKQVEQRLQQLIRSGRYLTLEEQEGYLAYLQQHGASQEELDQQRRQIPVQRIRAAQYQRPEEKRDTLALRLSDFLRDLDPQDQTLLTEGGWDKWRETDQQQMENQLGDPPAVQQLLDALTQLRLQTTDAYSRSNAQAFREELLALHPCIYRYREGSLVQVAGRAYRMETMDREKVILQDTELPLLKQSYSRLEFEKLLDADPANAPLKAVYVEGRTPDPPAKERNERAEPLVQLQFPPAEPEKEPELSALIGKTLTIEDHTYRIAHIGAISGDVSLQEISASGSSIPILRVEKLGYVQRLLKQGQASPEAETEPIEPAAEAGRPDKMVMRKQHPAEPGQPPTKEEPKLPDAPQNYHRTDEAQETAESGFSAKEKVQGNLAAIRLLQKLEQEQRPAEPEEQAILAAYTGWGGLPMVFDKQQAAWAREYAELKSLLPEEDYRAAMESTLTAFYTPPVVIRAMYDLLLQLGFSQGRILEPSCGIGGFFSLLPQAMAGSDLYGVELDPLSGRIAAKLYPKATINICGFEEAELADDSFDVALGNVPFGEFRIRDSRYPEQNFFIHDFFFAKALDKVRPGGVVLFLTSKGTMDKKDPQVRRYLAERAELLGAIRLPDNTFSANAGTRVTSDLLVLQKRETRLENEPDWLYLDTDEQGISMNRYFVQHPEMILGEMKREQGRFGMDMACKADPDVPLAGLLQSAIQRIHGQIPQATQEQKQTLGGQGEAIPADPDVRNFSFALVEGALYFRENQEMLPAKVSKTAESRIRGLIVLRDCVRRLLQLQMDDRPEPEIQAEQERLNHLYDAFTAEHGRINSRGNSLAFAADESYFLLCSLEVLDDAGDFQRKADLFTRRTIRPHRAVTSVETASEALAVSIGEKACVDLPYMMQLAGKTEEALLQELQGVIFRIPGSEPAQYETADAYLSGNVREKLAQAEAAAKTHPEYAGHAAALKRVIPEDLPASEIAVRLGSTWIPQADIQQFVMELLTPGHYAAERIRVRYTALNGDWFVENKGADSGNIKATSTYGTKRANAYRILEDTLNLRDVRIFDSVQDEQGRTKAVLNVKETMAAQAKQTLLKQAFSDWIWKDPERRARLVRRYNDTFNSIRPRVYDGSHITFGGISPDITLRPHQVNAIAHILYGGNTLLAHKVGAGKSATRS